ncbi:MAG: B12-binding domain-containing radical SAM protein [bacterium]|nr:MAG: B12-binding domain-containing radical SAM protein [bacterium]
MKCALIIPSWVPEDIFASKTAGSQINYWQPLGTVWVATAMMEAGHEVKFYNGAFKTNSDILTELGNFKPDFVGLYSTAFGWKRAIQAASDIRKLLKENVHITVGGPYPIAGKEKCLEDSKDIDTVVTGEGERTVVEMLERLSSGKNLSGVQGVIYRENGTIVKNPDRPLIEDLDSVPFPSRELLGDSKLYVPAPAMYRRQPVALVMTSRGCDRRCLYCFQIDKKRESGTRGIRFRSVENVMKEIELCMDQGYKEIKFIDDTLAADYDRAMELAKAIKASKFDFTWFVSACVNQVDEPLLRAFKEAGCWAILFGAESGVQKNLNTLRKGIKIEHTRSAVKAAKKVGLKVSTPFIFGIPGETYEEAMQTIDFAIELDPDVANFHSLTPFPGAELYDNVEKYGTMTGDLSDCSYQGAAFIPYTMTREQILELRQIAFKRFYMRPRYILKRILDIRNVNDFKANIKGFKSLFGVATTKMIFARKNDSGASTRRKRETADIK